MQPELHGSLFDSWMLQHFPGRTLEEIDEIDILRFMRAMEARALESSERLAASISTKKMKATDIEKSDLERVLENNVLWEEYVEGKWLT